MSTDHYKKNNNEQQKIDSIRKKNKLFTLLKVVGGFIAFSIISLVLIAALFEKQIAEMVIKTLNKQLKTELKVTDASLSLIWKFPRAAVYLHDAQLDGVGGQKEKLLNVESISLQCGTIGLLMGNYNFNSIAIENGSLFVHVDSKGKVNYDIFKPSETVTEENSDLSLSISNATLSNITVHYVNEGSKYDVKILANSAYFEGDFVIDNKLNKNRHTMTSYAELYSEHVIIGETVYLKGKELAYDGAVNLDLAKEVYSFEKIKLYLQGNEFKVDGSISKVAKGMQYNITFDSDHALLGSLLQLVPEQYAATLGQFESNGSLSFDARVNGISSPKTSPIIEVNFGLKDGRLSHPDLAGSMKNVNFKVHFTNGNGIDDRTAKLSLVGFQAAINDEPINVSWEMIGLKDPLITMVVDGRIPLASVYGFLGEKVTEGSGYVEVAKLSLDGRLNDMTSMNTIPRVKLGGVINFNQAQLMVNNISTNIAEGKLSLENNVFSVNNLTINTTASQFVLNGEFQNLLPVLLSDSLNTENAQLTFKASLFSEKMDIDELLAMGSGHSTAEIQAAPEAEKDSLTQESYERRAYNTSFLKGTFITNIIELKYGKVLAKNFNGEVEFDNSTMSLKSVKVDAMDGGFEVNSKVYFEKEPRLELYLNCKNIDIQQFLTQFDNFGQDVLTADNIRGKVESLIKVNLFLDSLGNFKHEDLYIIADVQIKTGELINLKMLEGFSSFIKMRDLQHIVFTDLKNQFRIENGRFFMPAMFIQSNALNILVGGEYGFNHDLDFKLKINAGQVLANKFKKYNPDKPAIKAKQQGIFNIYAHIFGNVYNKIDYKIGPKNTKKFLDAQLSQDLPAIANSLQEEFSKSAIGNEVQPVVQVLTQPSDWEDIPGGDDGTEN